MAKTKSTLEFYGYDYDSTMEKAFKSDLMGVFAISKLKELKNEKYIKGDD